ncbi:hypothetical protein [Streptomyces sp. NPDC059008]|uniref:hypothetical protein n=1 Tax=Streptomyces sp. NPDC059008 TaxID=3346693 RepID=UPI003681A045
MLGQIVSMRLARGEVAWAQVALLVGVTAALGTVFALNFTIGHLRAARRQVERLAVNQERERVAPCRWTASSSAPAWCCVPPEYGPICPSRPDAVRAELREVFGYVVREAVTNVLRHSDAALCTVRIGPDWVEATDNGGYTGGACARNGLNERLAAVSGTLEGGSRATGARPASSWPVRGSKSRRPSAPPSPTVSAA